MFGSNLIFKCNYDYKLLELDDCPQFYRAVLSSWQEVRDSFSEDIDITEEIIWNNKAILVNSKPIFFHSWYNAGVIKINDLLNNNGHSLLAFDELLRSFNIRTHFLYSSRMEQFAIFKLDFRIFVKFTNAC